MKNKLTKEQKQEWEKELEELLFSIFGKIPGPFPDTWLIIPGKHYELTKPLKDFISHQLKLEYEKGYNDGAKRQAWMKDKVELDTKIKLVKEIKEWANKNWDDEAMMSYKKVRLDHLLSYLEKLNIKK